MNLALLAAAPLAIKIHLATVLPAFVIGTWQIFFSTKGSRGHRVWGSLLIALDHIDRHDSLSWLKVDP